MKKVIKTIDVTTNSNLYKVACAMGEIHLLRKIGAESGAEEPKAIKCAMDSIVDVLGYKFQQIFIDEFPEYSKNKIMFGENESGMLVKVFEEKYDNADDADNNSAGSLDDMLNNIDGLDSADDYVEILANLKNKRGGQA